MYQAETCTAASLQARFRSPREIRLRSFWQRPHRSSRRPWNILEQPLHRRLRQLNQESVISALHGFGALSNPTPDHWFDLTAFQPTTDNTGTYGNSSRDILRAPGIVQADLSIVKNTRFKERFEHQFKVEMFNALNHPHFGAPGSTIGTATAGVISSLLYQTHMRQIQLAMKLSF